MARPLLIALALGAASLAGADQFPRPPLSACDTPALPQAVSVERDGEGRIVAMTAPGLEPADAPYAPVDAMAQARAAREILIGEQRRRQTGAG